MFPYPSRRRAARRPPAGLPRHRRHQPVPAGWTATTCCTRWATTPSACPPSSTPCRPGSTRGSPPRPTSRRSARQLRRLGVDHDGRAASPRSTRATTSGPSGSSCRSSAPGSTSTRQGAPDRGAGAGAGRRHARARARHQPAGPAVGRAGRRSDADWSSTRTGWPTCTRRRSTGARGWARCCPTRRSPPTGAPSAATSRSFRRPLTQWMMRITAYADRLLDDLDRLDWSESLKLMQRNWIGRSTGAADRVLGGRRDASRSSPPGPTPCSAPPTWCWRPSTRWSASLTADAWPDGADPRWTGGAATRPRPVAAYQRQASRRSELDRQDAGREKTGVWLGVTAINPVNGRELPVFIADYVLTGYGTGAIMAVPGEDTRDWEFAEAFGLPVVRTVQPPADFDGGAYTGTGPMINSSNEEISLDGLDEGRADRRHHRVAGAARARRGDHHLQAARLAVQPAALLGRAVPDRLRRERPAGRRPELDAAGAAARGRRLLAEDLRRRRRRLRPEPPLSRATEWTTVELDLGDGPRSTAARPTRCPTGPGRAGTTCATWTPATTSARRPRAGEVLDGPAAPGDVGGVDLYVGGVEHAVLHLLYARFWHKVLFDLGYVSSEEPFRRLVNQGYISAYAYTDERGFYVPGVGGRGVGRPVPPRGQAGQPRVREDRQEPEERRHARRDDRRVRRRHLPGVRDVDRAAGPVAAVGDQGRRRLAAAAAADLAGRRRRGDRCGARRRRRAGRGHPARAAPDDRRRARRHDHRCGSTSPSPGSPS